MKFFEKIIVLSVALFATLTICTNLNALPIPGCGPGMGCCPAGSKCVVQPQQDDSGLQSNAVQAQNMLQLSSKLITNVALSEQQVASLIPMGPFPPGEPDGWCQWCTYIPLNGLVCVPYPC